MILSDLPSELIENIFASLDWRDLLECQKVCKLFYTIIRSTARLQYIIELSVAGYVHGGEDGYISAAEHLENLKNHQKSWKDPRIDRVELIELDNEPDQPSSFPFVRYEIRDDVLVALRRKGSLQDPHAFNSIDVMFFESSNRVFPSWTLDLESSYTGFAFDPVQDLLILRDEQADVFESSNTHVIYTRYQALSLKDGVPHERSRCREIRITQPVVLEMIVLGDFVASPIIHDLRSLDAVILVNWITGVIHKIRPATGLGSRVRAADLCFLSESKLFTMDERRPALHLYCSTSLGWEDVQHTAIFDLPRYQNYAISASVLTSSKTCDRRNIYPSLSRSRAVFYPDPSEAPLVCLQLRFLPHAYNQDQASKIFTVVICVSRMLDILARIRGRTDSRIPTIMQWTTWGPSCTRWFGHVAPLRRLRIYGYRIVLPNRILDFNPVDISRDIALDRILSLKKSEENSDDLDAGGSIGASEDIITEPTVVPKENLFSEDIHTSLHYREIVLNTTLPFVDIYPNSGVIGLQHTNNVMAAAIISLHFLTV